MSKKEAQRAAKAQKQADVGIKHKSSSEGKVPWLVCQHGRISVVVNSGTLVGHLTHLDDIREERVTNLVLSQ